MKWETLSSEYIFRHKPYIQLRRDICKQPNGNIVPAYYVAELPLSVIVFPVIDNKVLLVKQYRHPINEVLWELPGGFTEENEDPAIAALRELKEETGYEFSSLTSLGKLAGNPGILNNYTYLYFVNGNYKRTKQRTDDYEDITTRLFSFEELKEMIKKNEIRQALHLNACFLALMHLNKMQFIE